MHFHHPPAKKYKLLPQSQSPMETIVLHLSPYDIGRLGGEMTQRMVNAAQGYLEEVTAHELQKAFRQEIYQNFDPDPVQSTVTKAKQPFINASHQSGGEVRANQYPSENGTH